MSDGRVEAIYVAEVEGGPQRPLSEATLAAGQGIVGDRYLGISGRSGRNLTLVEAEEIDAFNAAHGTRFDYEATRRNVVTRGIRLNDLVGKEFTIGGVRARGVRLCEPCTTLGENLESPELASSAIIAGFTHRAGLRADILSPGVIAIGDPVRAGNPVSSDGSRVKTENPA